MPKGRKYAEAAVKYDRQSDYSLAKAIDMLKDMSYVKFDETVEVSVRLNLKRGHTVRDTVVLPYQFGNQKQILVFAKGEKADEAREAGAAFVGDADLVEKIQGGWLGFDVAVATPDMMRDVGKLGRILGRRGLMPNPKAGTVTMDVKGALEELQKGRREFRADKTGVVHMAVGKVSMETVDIQANARVFIDEVTRKRPADLKGDYIKSISCSSTMGPGVRVGSGEE